MLTELFLAAVMSPGAYICLSEESMLEAMAIREAHPEDCGTVQRPFEYEEVEQVVAMTRYDGEDIIIMKLKDRTGLEFYAHKSDEGPI